jgi:hypothetical protein
MEKCRCDICEARENNITPLEYAYKDRPVRFALVKKFPGYAGYIYEDVFREITKNGLYDEEQMISDAISFFEGNRNVAVVNNEHGRKGIHFEDIKVHFLMPTKTHCCEPEYQEWFLSGLRLCRKHPYPFQWHVMQSIECPKCKEEKHE